MWYARRQIELPRPVRGIHSVNTKYPVFHPKFRVPKHKFLVVSRGLEGLGSSGRLVYSFPPILVPVRLYGAEIWPQTWDGGFPLRVGLMCL